MNRWPVLGVLAAALGLPALAAPGVVVYRCVAADGAVTLQNDRRCPKGAREERRVLETPTSRAPAVATPVRSPAAITPIRAPAPDAAGPQAASGATATPTVDATTSPLPAGQAPAPPLFACRTWDGRRYYGDSEQPAPRCAPLETVGLDRRSATDAQACEMRLDTCEPVADTARCGAWAERLRTAESTAAFGEEPAAGAARVEAARLRTALAGTVCAG